MTETRASASLHITIPRTEEVHEKGPTALGLRGGARTVFVVQVCWLPVCHKYRVLERAGSALVWRGGDHLSFLQCHLASTGDLQGAWRHQDTAMGAQEAIWVLRARAADCKPRCEVARNGAAGIAPVRVRTPLQPARCDAATRSPRAFSAKPVHFLLRRQLPAHRGPFACRRKLIGHTDPRYLSAFRDELQVRRRACASSVSPPRHLPPVTPGARSSAHTGGGEYDAASHPPHYTLTTYLGLTRATPFHASSPAASPARQVYLGTVVELVRRDCDQLSLELSDMLLKLELPAPKDSSTWEQRGPVTGVGQVRVLLTGWLVGPTHGVLGGRGTLRTLLEAPACAPLRVQAPITLDGFLRKQGGWRNAGKAGQQRKWRQRWFVLTGSTLYYYADRSSAEHKGKMELHGCHVAEANVDRDDEASGGEYFQVGRTTLPRAVLATCRHRASHPSNAPPPARSSTVPPSPTANLCPKSPPSRRAPPRLPRARPSSPRPAARHRDGQP